MYLSIYPEVGTFFVLLFLCCTPEKPCFIDNQYSQFELKVTTCASLF